jgi:hypothetical protein
MIKRMNYRKHHNHQQGNDPVSVLFVDAQKGAGIYALKREIIKVGEPVQEKRIRKD